MIVSKSVKTYNPIISSILELVWSILELQPTKRALHRPVDHPTPLEHRRLCSFHDLHPTWNQCYVHRLDRVLSDCNERIETWKHEASCYSIQFGSVLYFNWGYPYAVLHYWGDGCGPDDQDCWCPSRCTVDCSLLLLMPFRFRICHQTSCSQLGIATLSRTYISTIRILATTYFSTTSFCPTGSVGILVATRA